MLWKNVSLVAISPLLQIFPPSRKKYSHRLLPFNIHNRTFKSLGKICILHNIRWAWLTFFHFCTYTEQEYICPFLSVVSVVSVALSHRQVRKTHSFCTFAGGGVFNLYSNVGMSARISKDTKEDRRRDGRTDRLQTCWWRRRINTFDSVSVSSSCVYCENVLTKRVNLHSWVVRKRVWAALSVFYI